MNRELLEAVTAAYSRSQPVVLVRGLLPGPQYLVDRAGVRTFGASDAGSGNLPLPGELLRSARDALARDGARGIEFQGARYLLETIAPPPRLFVIGAVHIAQKLIPMAVSAGYRVLLLDPREAFATTERFPNVKIIHDWPHEALPKLTVDMRCAVVTLSHDAKIDDPALRAALESEAFYIGALGSRKNHTKRLQRLAACGFDPGTLGRIHGPIGLPLGGRSPAEIAVAILAQITQSRYAR